MGLPTTSIATGVRPNLRTILISFVGLVSLVGCASTQNADDLSNYIASDPNAARLVNSDSTLIVDCLLPGKIKKMGRSFTYLTPRRPVKVSSQDCEIRGGEYVAYDRANYQTALRVWLPLAQEGDMVAQAYVASIYEKGLGIDPDYEKAFSWYQKSANQGYARAQYSLGYLYEMGLGVDKNLNEAFKWYRQAAGLEEKDIRIAHVELAKGEREKLKAMREAEQALLDKVVNEIDAKKEQLVSLDKRLSEEQAQLELAKARLAKKNQEREQLALKIEKDRQHWQAEVKRLETQLATKQSELAKAEQSVVQQKPIVQRKQEELALSLDNFTQEKSTLLSVLTALQADRSQVAENDLEKQREMDAKIAQKKSQLRNLNAAIEKQQALAEENGRRLNAMIKEVAAKKAELEREKRSLADAQAMMEADKAKHTQEYAELKRELAQQREKEQRELARQQRIIAQLKNQKKLNEEKLSYLNHVEGQETLALLAPKIEMLEPQVPLVRSGMSSAPVLKVRDDLRQREIVGKVLSDEALLLVSMNEQSLELSPQGVFKTVIDVPKTGTMVDIVALDVKGQRSQLKFVLSPDKGKYTDVVEQEPSKPIAKELYSEIEFGDYYALLIGNNDYQYLPKLLTPIKDIEATAEVLKSKYGFKETILLENATRYDIITQLNALRKKLTEKDNLVIYYAGHGEIDRVNMSGQWLPIDAEPDNTANWISNNALTELVNAITAKHVLVVADSCFSGLLTRTGLTNIEGNKSDEARANWLAKMAKKRARLVLTSGGVAPVLDEGGGEHSIFARAFIDILKANDDVLEGQQLFRQVSAMVAIAADRYRVDQVPEYAPVRHAGHESGDFILVPSI